MLLPGVARAEDGTYGYLKYSIKNDKITITGLADENVTAVDIPSTIDGKPVEAIADYAFAHRKVESINIPASVTTIGLQAFDNCNPLSSVTFSENSNLKEIGNLAFNKTALTSFSVPASVEKMGNYVFSDCYYLSSVTFNRIPIGGNGISNYPKNMFDECRSLKSINVPSGCVEIYKAQLPSYAAKIQGEDIFVDGLKYSYNLTGDGLICKGLLGDVKQILVVPETAQEMPVTAIAEGAFSETGITSIEIPSSVTTIGDNAFSECSSLISVTFCRIPIGEYKITDYSNTMFAECSSLTIINVPDGCMEIYKAQLSNKASQIQGEDIVADGLKYAYNLKGDGLICLGFSGDAQDALVIPAEVGDMPVTDVKERAFSGCEQVEQITILGDATSIASNAFQGMTALKHIFVTNDAYSYYKNQNFENADKLVVYEKDGKFLLIDAKGLSELENPTLFDPQALSYSRKVETADGEYATLCLPFAIKLSESNEVFEKVYVPLTTMIHDKAHSTDGVESFILMLKEQAEDAEIPAGQPMFVKLAAGHDEFTFTNPGEVTLQKDMEPSVYKMTVLDWDGTSGLMTENRQFNISYTSRYLEPIAATADMNIWSFNDNGTFGPQTEGNLNPFRLFLSVEGLTAATQAKAYSISIGVNDDSTTTGIREIISADTIGAAGANGTSKHDGIIYDLNGRKVTTADKAKSQPKGVYILNGKKMVIK